MKVLVVFGTRPEAVKMCPVILELQRHSDIETLVCVTGQHRSMLDQVLEVFGVIPNYDLDIMRPQQSITDITVAVLNSLPSVLSDFPPDVVLVHGDTTTSMSAALASFYQQIPVGHVEAGLRSYNRYSPFPEEVNRKLVSSIATYHFAPTQRNAETLTREGITENVIVTGNTVIDSFAVTLRDDYRFKDGHLAKHDFSKKTILMTAHRRENLGGPLNHICRAVRTLLERHEDLFVVYPVHLNPAVRETVFSILGNCERAILTNPVDVVDMHNAMARSYLVLTDSGGIQEEAPHLRKPVVVLRTETERPEAVEAGTAIVVGTWTDSIITHVEALLEEPLLYRRMSTAANPYGDGHASKRIVEYLRTTIQS